MENFFTKDNMAVIAVIISMISLLFTFFSYRLNKNKAEIETSNRKREKLLATEKLRDSFKLISGLKNIEPSNLSPIYFAQDKVLLNTFLDDCKKNLETISKLHDHSPFIISQIQNILTKLETGYDPGANNNSQDPFGLEVINNYINLYYHLYILALPIAVMDSQKKIKKEGDNYYKDFAKIHDNFQAHHRSILVNKSDELYRNFLENQ